MRSQDRGLEPGGLQSRRWGELTRSCACSAVWLDNATDRPVSFRLHVPVTPLTAPPPPQGTDPTDVRIGPLKPQGGAWPPPRDAVPHCCAGLHATAVTAAPTQA